MANTQTQREAVIEGVAFYYDEFACICGCDHHTKPRVRAAIKRLVTNLLAPARARLGCGILIYSGVRCEAQNQRSGGADQSRHMVGDAADCIPTDRSKLWVLYDIMIDIIDNQLDGKGGLKCYDRKNERRPSFVHGDTRTWRWVPKAKRPK